MRRKIKVFSENHTYKASVLRDCWDWLRQEYDLDDLGYSEESEYINRPFTIILEIVDESEISDEEWEEEMIAQFSRNLNGDKD